MCGIELQFEKVRRQIAPNAPSRLSCLFVVDNSKEGVENIKEMLGPNVFLLKVRIPAAIRVAKADRRWFDAYCSNADLKNVENYWFSRAFSPGNRWEYLIDGMIEAVDDSQIEYIRKNGAKIE
ncbi:MAG: DUF2441 domain-containing protein [Firmicutes bacterium]|nr:DUF2441 domain-containing protein [Bacillota bacterium]